MKLLKEIFLILFCVYYIFTIIQCIIDFIIKKIKKDKITNKSSIENEDSNNNYKFPLFLSIFEWLIILIIATFVFMNGCIIILINILMLFVCFIALLHFLKQSLFNKNDTNQHCYFDQFNGLSLFCVATVIAIIFNMHINILNLIKHITTGNLHDVLIVLFFLASFFINIFYIFILFSSLLSKFEKFKVLQKLLKMVSSCAENIQNIFHALSKIELSTIKNAFFKIILGICFVFVFVPFFIPILALLYLLLCFIMLCLRFLIGLSWTNNGLFLSFFVLISSILSLIFSFVLFHKNASFIYDEENLKIFEFISSTILIPLVYDCINKYADKVKNNLINNK